MIKSGEPIDDPSKMLSSKNDPKYQERWPRALVRYKRICGVDEPKHLMQGADAGLYENSDIRGIRILNLKPVARWCGRRAYPILRMEIRTA